jgi:hypothetical protein
MKIDRFDDGFDETDDRGERCASAETGAAPEPDFGYGDNPEPAPDFGPEDWDDTEPEPAPDQLWPRTEEGVEEPPAVAATPALPARSEPPGDSEKADQGLGLARQPKTKAPFIKGPLCREWIVRALLLRKSAIAVGLGLWLRAGLEKDDFIRGRRAESVRLRVDRRLKKQIGVTPSQCSRGIFALEAAGLIRVVKGGAGRCPVVVIVNLQIPLPVGRKSRT